MNALMASRNASSEWLHPFEFNSPKKARRDKSFSSICTKFFVETTIWKSHECVCPPFLFVRSIALIRDFFTI